MARPAKEKTYVNTDTSAFSEEELQQLEQEAKEEFALESKTQAADAFKEATKTKLRQKAMFSAGKSATGDDLEPIMINLAPNSPHVTINGQIFYHGVTYKFTRAQAASMNEIMHRTWMHEREIGGANMNAEAGRAPLNRRI